MDQAHRLQIAQRIHDALMREMNQGIDPQLMLHSELYARDVLLVCQAYDGHELQRLGQDFSRAGPAAEANGAASVQRRAPPGLPALLAQRATSRVEVEAVKAATAPPDSRWLHPSRWFAD